MKKIISLLLCALLVCAVLPSTRVSAEGGIVELGGCYSISSGKTVSLPDTSGTICTTAQLNMYSNSTLIIPKGVTLRLASYPKYKQRLNVYGSNVTIEVYGRLETPDVWDISNRVEGAEFGSNCKVNVYNGGSINVSYPEYGAYSSVLFQTLPDPENIFSGVDGAVVHCYHGTRNTTSSEQKYVHINSDHTFSDDWSYDGEHHWHDATCGHNVKGDYAEHSWTSSGSTTVCAVCGAEKDLLSGSTLSQGSVTIIVGVAAATVGFLAAMFIFKKKPATANNSESNEEE